MYRSLDCFENGIGWRNFRDVKIGLVTKSKD